MLSRGEREAWFNLQQILRTKFETWLHVQARE